MSGRHRKPGRNPGPALAVAAATALIVPGLMAGTHASATETAMTRAAQPSWWHTAHVAHVARLARLGEAAIVTQAPGSRAPAGKRGACRTGTRTIAGMVMGTAGTFNCATRSSAAPQQHPHGAAGRAGRPAPAAAPPEQLNIA